MSFDFGMPEFSAAFAGEERRRHSAPPDETEVDPDADLFPYDEGYEARVCCQGREANPYKSTEFRTAWNLGWDAADAAPEEISPQNKGADGECGNASQGLEKPQ